MIFLLFLLLLAVSAVLTFGFAVYALRHPKTLGARPFALVLVGHGLSAAWYACELMADTLASKIVWDNLQFTAIDMIVVGYVWFALEYTNRHKAVQWLLPLFWGLPLLNALLVWSNPAHHLVRSASRIIVQGDLSVLTYTYEPWFWVYLIYIYLGTLAAVGILVVAVVRTPRFYHLQVGAVILGMLAPLVGGMFTVGGLIPVPELDHLDVSPLTYLLIAPLWSWALFRQRFLDLVPMARSYLIEAMPDGILVVDAQGRVVDCNPGARAMLSSQGKPCIGMHAKTLLPALLLIAEPSRILIKDPRADAASDESHRWLDVRSTPLHNKRNRHMGWLVIVHDQTEYWQMEQSLREQNARLEQEIIERQQAEEAYRNLVQYSFQGLMIMQERRVVFANPAIETIHGYTIAELQAMSPEELVLLIHPDDRAVVRQRIEAFADDTALAHRYEHRIIHKQGHTRWVEVYVAQVEYRRARAFQLAFIDITERKHAEEALRESEARLKAVFDNAAVGIGLTDDAGKSIAVNARGAQQLGYTLEEMGHLSNADITHPDDHAATAERMQQLLRGEVNGYRIEKRYFRKDGSIFWADLSVSAIYNEQGQISHLLGIVVDITERKHAEEALRESEQFVQQIASMIPGILYVYDLNLERNIYSNREVYEVLGYTTEDVHEMGSNAMPILLHPDDLPHVLHHRMLHEQAEEGTILNLEYRMRHRDGHWRWLFSREIVFMRTADGLPRQILGIAQDITERKHAEEALRESERFVQQITTTIPDILYIYDLTLESNVYSNRQMADVLGYTPEEVQDMGSDVMPTLVHPDDLPRVLDHLSHMRALPVGDNTRRTLEYRMRHRDGHWCWLFSREVVFTRTADGQPRQLVGVAHDITERKQLEQQLQQANQWLREQSIRDPLTGLHNRRYLDETLPRELQRAERRSQSVGVIMLDIDHFKHFNDTYGHDAGDALLQRVGAFLQSCIRGEDIACRYGGEEFILVLLSASLADTRQRAEDLCKGVQALSVEHRGQILDGITASFGVAIFPEHSTTAEGIIKAADEALYRAKHGGRNHVVAAM
jgi:diguanylate cyclase (GGDEF)-like protein/PAS domain S-box-containing protein